MGHPDLSEDDPPRAPQGAGADPQPGENRRRNRATLGWYIAVVVLILLALGWIPALIFVLTTLCIGFILTQQKREERRR